MENNRKNILQAGLISVILTSIVSIFYLLPLIVGDASYNSYNFVVVAIWLIGFFLFLTIILNIGLREYKKTKKVWDGVRSGLFWWAKVRMITLVGGAIFCFFYIVFYYLTNQYIPEYSTLISITISILFASLIGVFYYRLSSKKAEQRAKEWKKLEEDRKRIRGRILNNKK